MSPALTCCVIRVAEMLKSSTLGYVSVNIFVYGLFTCLLLFIIDVFTFGRNLQAPGAMSWCEMTSGSQRQ